MPTAWDYALSLHYGPLVSSAVMATIGSVTGLSWSWTFAIIGFGSLVSAVAFYVQPLLHMKPKGGEHYVGLREISGSFSKGLPPITVTYPTLKPPQREGVEWVPFLDIRYLKGMARYVGFPVFLLRDFLFCRVAMSPLAPPMPLYREDGTARPIFLFSHGLSGYSRLYSTFLMDTAARGAIVFSVNHLDESAAFCRDAGDEIAVELNSNIKWTTEAREPQLRQRVREIRHTLLRICDGELLKQMGYADDVVSRYTGDKPQIHFVGHSFGGATVLASCMEEETERMKASGSAAARKIASATVFDPWMVPLEKGLFMDKLNTHSSKYVTPTLLLFSEEWCRDEAQYRFFVNVETQVKQQSLSSDDAAMLDAVDAKLRQSKGSWFARRNYDGSGHLSCTDTCLLSPVVFRQRYMTASPRALLVKYAQDTVEYANAIEQAS